MRIPIRIHALFVESGFASMPYMCIQLHLRLAGKDQVAAKQTQGSRSTTGRAAATGSKTECQASRHIAAGPQEIQESAAVGLADRDAGQPATGRKSHIKACATAKDSSVRFPNNDKGQNAGTI